MDIDVSVIVSTCNRAGNIQRFLACLQEVKVRPTSRWELVLVDNGSTDHTPGVVHSFLPSARYPIIFLSETRRGKSQGLNSGIAAANGKILAFTDDDVFVSPGWVRIICDYFEQNRNIACIGGMVRLSNPEDAPITTNLSTEPAVVDASNFRPDDIPILGCNMAVRADALAKVGPFDTDIGPGAPVAAGEDLDVLYRLIHGGFRLAYVPEMLVYHNHGRRAREEIQHLKTGYMVGRGAFYGKFLLQKDGLVARWAYREFRSILGRELLKAPFNCKSRRHLRESFQILSGAMTYVRIHRRPKAMSTDLRNSTPAMISK